MAQKGVVVARSTPRVDDSGLTGGDGTLSSIAVGSPAWYAWLEGANTFAFAGAQGSFTARKERGTSWRAYRKRDGRLQQADLGQSADLTPERLSAIASELAGRASGSPADEAPQLAPPAETLTFLFADVEDSMQLWEQHQQAMPAALARYDAILRQAVEAHGGVVFKTFGDSVHAVFAAAPDALAAALAGQRGLQAEHWGPTGPLRVRMALHSGVAVARDGDYYGAPLNRLARMLAAGHGGQILLALATEDLARERLPTGVRLHNLGVYQLRDLRQAEPIFQLVGAGLPTSFPPLHAPQALTELAHAQPNLLNTKLHVPLARPQLVARPRLLAQLDAGLAGKLTLLSAPAGFGKTTLLAEWLASATEDQGPRAEGNPALLRPQSAVLDTRVAWVSLDAADSDPLRFWRYIIAALDMIQPDTGASALALLQSLQPPPIEALLTPLLNSLSALPSDAVLVLDDYHQISTPSIHTALAFLIDHLPPQLHVVIATRADPPLPLARLRARRQLTELRAADLRFTAEEAAAFLTELMALPLSADDIAALEARTEGWIAGLQFAALAMRDRHDLAGFIRAFTGSHRFVVDYLAEEVLARQPAHLQMFLTQTAILDRMCGPLCDAVLGLTPDERPTTNDQGHAVASETVVSQDHQLSSFVLRPSSDSYSQLILDQLERANLFVLPLDDERHWYRYHHLFAEVLRERLTRGATSAAVAALHRRASAWFEEQQLIPEAIQHALAAQDWARAADVIEQHAQSLMFRGQVHTVAGWMNRLAAPLVHARPGLCVLSALRCMFTNDLSAAAAPLQQAEQWIATHPQDAQVRVIRGWVAAIRASILRIRGDLAGCVQLSQQTADLLPETELIGAAARVNLVHAYLVSGDVRPDNEHMVAAAVAAARASGNLISTLRSMTLLARLQVLQGRLQAAASTYAAAAQIAPGPDGLQGLVNSAAYYSGMGDLRREQNDFTAAARYLELGMERVRETLTVDAHVVWRCYLAQARLAQAAGNGSAALATLDQFEQIARERSYAPELIARAGAARARLWLMQGELAAATIWMERSGLDVDDSASFPREAEYVTLARVLIAQGRAGQTLELLARLLAAAEQGARMHSAIELLTVRALAWQAQGTFQAALADLGRALALAAPEGFVRMFVDEGWPIAMLLAQIAGVASPVAEYASALQQAFPERQDTAGRRREAAAPAAGRQPPASELVEPLSAREHEVLRLIADGHSNQAIAERLVVAVSTVKKHVNNLYGKLGVQSRTQALARARELRLL